MSLNIKRIEELIDQQNAFLINNCLAGKGCYHTYTNKAKSASVEIMCCDAMQVISQITCAEVLSYQGTRCTMYTENI